MSYTRYWWALTIVIVGSFIVLGGEGRKMISGAPPLPDVYTTDGQLLFTGSSITDGQGVWQSIGGQALGAQIGCMLRLRGCQVLLGIRRQVGLGSRDHQHFFDAVQIKRRAHRDGGIDRQSVL